MAFYELLDSTDLKLIKSIKILLSDHPKLFNFMFDQKAARLKAPSDRILDEAQHLSSGEYLLVQVALDLWDGSGHALFKDLRSILSHSNRKNLLESIKYLESTNNPVWSMKNHHILAVANKKSPLRFKNLAN